MRGRGVFGAAKELALKCVAATEIQDEENKDDLWKLCPNNFMLFCPTYFFFWVTMMNCVTTLIYINRSVGLLVLVGNATTVVNKWTVLPLETIENSSCRLWGALQSLGLSGSLPVFVCYEVIGVEKLLMESKLFPGYLHHCFTITKLCFPNGEILLVSKSWVSCYVGHGRGNTFITKPWGSCCYHCCCFIGGSGSGGVCVCVCVLCLMLGIGSQSEKDLKWMLANTSLYYIT